MEKKNEKKEKPLAEYDYIDFTPYDTQEAFLQLTPTQRLEWLASMVQFYHHPDLVKFRNKKSEK